MKIWPIISKFFELLNNYASFKAKWKKASSNSSSSFIQGFPHALWTSEPTKLSRFGGGSSEVETHNNGIVELHTPIVVIPSFHFLFFPSFSFFLFPFFLYFSFSIVIATVLRQQQWQKQQGEKLPTPPFPQLQLQLKLHHWWWQQLRGRSHPPCLHGELALKAKQPRAWALSNGNNGSAPTSYCHWLLHLPKREGKKRGGKKRKKKRKEEIKETRGPLPL